MRRPRALFWFLLGVAVFLTLTVTFVVVDAFQSGEDVQLDLQT